jgi:hypothetical protein
VGLWRCTEWPRPGLSLCRFQFFVLNDQELIFANLVSAAFVVGLHNFTSAGVHELMA